MALYAVQNVLNGGEISPLLYGRFDQPRYQTGAYVMRNVIPLPQGGATRRPGTLFCGHAADESTAAGGVRLVPFIFSGTQSRILEFSPGTMRVWAANGGRVPGAGGAPYELALPYTAADIPGLCFAQSADVVFIASSNHKPAKISRYADNHWVYEVLTFRPKTPSPGVPWLAAGGTVPGNGSQTYSYRIVAVSDESGELSAPSGASDIAAGTLSTTYYIDISWGAVAGVKEYRVYKKKAGVYGFIGRALNGETTFRDNNIGPDAADTPSEIKTPFEQADDYPSLVFFHQQRLGWAATLNRPLTLWLSQSANFESLAASLIPRDDDGMEATIAGQQQSRILWLLPDRDVLCIGTSSGEWTMQATQSGVFSPSNHGFLPQSDIGAAEGLPALRAAGGVLFLQRGGQAVRVMGYSFQTDKYEPQDLSILARHVLRGRGVTSWCRQAEPHGIIWFCLSDGTLAGLTLLREHDVVGWHRHDTDGHIEQVACIPGPGGGEDLLWLVVRRQVNGQARRFIEVMAPHFDSEDKETAYFVDAGVSRLSAVANSLAGLGHLEGRTVTIFSDGYVSPAGKVENDSISLDVPARVVHAGLPFVSEIQPTRAEVTLPEGGSLGRVRRIAKVTLRLYQTMHFTVSLTAIGSTAQAGVRNLSTSNLEDLPAFILQGDVNVPLGGGWQEDARLVIRTDGPCPLTVLAVVAEVELAREGGGYR